ncbi:MAG: hypothetical protein R2809_07335 [Flavobacteriales bacterium]
MKSIKLILSVLLFAIGGQLLAQRDTTIHMESQFEGERKLFLKDANKLSVNPFVKEQMVDMLTIRYSTLPTRKAFLIDPKAISPAKINVEDKLARLYRGYIKVGYGTYGTVPADFYFTDGRSKKGTFGVNYHMLRSSGLSLNDNDTIPDRYSENKVELWGRRFIKKSVLEAAVNWERNLNHWYGFDNQTIDGSRLVLDSLRQRLNTFGGRASFRTYNRDTADLNFGTSIAIRGTSDLYKGKETNVDWVATASKLVNTELFSGEVGVNYNSFAYVGPDLSKYGYPLLGEEDIRERKFDNAVVRLIPMAQTVWRDLRAKVGMALYIEARGENPGHFYPLAEVSYNLLDGLIVPYAGIRGGVEQNSYLDLYKQNPFIQTFPDLRNKNTKFDMYGGVGGAISSELSFSAGVNYYSYDNFAYFVNDSLYSSDSVPTFFTSQGNKFTIIYDQLKTLNIHGNWHITMAKSGRPIFAVIISNMMKVQKYMHGTSQP